MANATPRRVYDFDSELATLKRKFPELELRLKGVPYDDDEERQAARVEWDSYPHDDGAVFDEEFKLKPTTLKIPSLAFMDDETALLSATNAPAALRAHIGDEAYERYVAGGGTSAVLFQIMQRDQQAHAGE